MVAGSDVGREWMTRLGVGTAFRHRRHRHWDGHACKRRHGKDIDHMEEFTPCGFRRSMRKREAEAVKGKANWDEKVMIGPDMED